jgi:hypothetical protein
MTEQEESKCGKCAKVYPKTKEYFYTSNGKLKLHMCKECKKEQSREAEKTRKPRKPRIRAYRDRREYTKMYYARKKLEKQAEKQALDSKGI